jgi:AraC-like DNA-binding protein
LQFPQIDRAATAQADAQRAENAAVERDWPALGARCRERTVAAQWWREPEIDLAELARRLGTNTNYLSRALNEGLGMNFSAFINRLRVEAAQQDLLQPGEILSIALDVGFRSKASFNRAFKEYVGCTPSEWRARSSAARITS